MATRSTGSRSPSTRRANTSDPRPNRTLLWAALAAVVAAAAVALGVAASRRGGDDAAVPQSRAVTVTGAPLAVAPEDPAAGPDPALAAVAPALEGVGFDGRTVAARPGGGRPLLVLFVAHWCPHCRREVPLLAPWLRQGQAPAGLDVVTVSTSADAGLPNYPPSKWLASEDWPTPVLADDAAGSAARAYGLRSFPYFVLLDADGRVVDRLSGEIAPADLAARITAALAGPPTAG